MAITTSRAQLRAFSIITLCVILAAAICLICDLAITGSMTWSRIVLLSLALGWSNLSALLLPAKHKAFTGLTCLSITLYPFLLALSRLLPYHSWHTRLALPIVLLSLGSIWAVCLLVRFSRMNGLHIAGLTVLLYGIVFNLGLSYTIIAFFGGTIFNLSNIITVILSLAAALILHFFGLLWDMHNDRRTVTE